MKTARKSRMRYVMAALVARFETRSEEVRLRQYPALVSTGIVSRSTRAEASERKSMSVLGFGTAVIDQFQPKSYVSYTMHL